MAKKRIHLNFSPGWTYWETVGVFFSPVFVWWRSLMIPLVLVHWGIPFHPVPHPLHSSHLGISWVDLLSLMTPINRKHGCVANISIQGNAVALRWWWRWWSGGWVGGEELVVCRHHSLSRDSELMQQFDVHVTNKGKQRNRKRRLLVLWSKQPNVSEGDGRQRKPGSAETERKLHPLMCFLFCGKYEKLFSFVLRCVMFQRQCGVCGWPQNWCRSSNVEISRPLLNVSLHPTKILFEFEFTLKDISGNIFH